MKSFSKRPLLVSASILLTGLFVSLTCCTNVDDGLGLEFIPDDQIMKIHQAVFGIEEAQQISLYTQMPDSIASSDWGKILVGNASDEKFGKTRAAAIVQMLPFKRADDEDFEETGGYKFNFRRTVDSIELVMIPLYLYGDASKEQRFEIFALRDTLVTDTTYYTFFDYEELKEPGPLFSFSLSGKYEEDYESSNYQFLKLETTVKGREYMELLLADTTYYYNNRIDFHERFKGFVIEPTADSPEDAAMYQLNLSSLYFYLNFHTYESETSNEVRDTLYVPYYSTFYQPSSSAASGYSDEGYPYNTSISTVSHDYAGTPVGQALTMTEEVVPQSISYIHGFGGVTTLVEFPDEFYEAILAMRAEGTDMHLNQAMIYFHLEEDTVELLDSSHKKLGSYYKYSADATIPDYSLYDEYSSNRTYYNGTLNRTHGYYSMDITTFMHYALKVYQVKKDGGEYNESHLKLILGSPTSYVSRELLFNPGQTAVKGAGTDEPISVRLTYTLVK